MPPKKLPPLPNFTGKVLERTAMKAADFKVYAYQYAFTSQPEGEMWPAAIVYVADDEDIQKAIQYAAENNLGVAVRSGGHQYLGVSSTNGRNIQLDLSGRLYPSRKAYPYAQISYNDSERLLKLGAGTTLEDVSTVTKDLGVFFPHGECCGVGVGGHTQTGGYGILARSFGLLVDHLYSFDIVLATGEKRTVTRDSKEQLDKDLFFAVCGGSPGNFGVLTSSTIRVMKDVDYPNACGVKIAWVYNKNLFRELAQIVNEANDDPEVPVDLNTSAIALGGQHTPNFHPLGGTTFDDEMAKEHPNLTGTYNFNYFIPMITFVAVWSNLKGAAQPEIDEVSKKYLDRVLALKGIVLTRDGKTGFDYHTKMPMSKLLDSFTILNPREFTLPFVKRLYYAKSMKLSLPDPTDGKTLAQWLEERLNWVESLWNVFENRGMKVAAQIGSLVGQPFNKPSNYVPMALGGRDATYMLGLDIFYDPTVNSRGAELAKAWCDENDRAIFANKYNFFFNNTTTGQQLRGLWGTFVTGNEVPNLDAQWRYYFDNEAVFQRLLAVKKAVDPKDVFTPNLFCIGASTSARFKDAPGAATGLGLTGASPTKSLSKGRRPSPEKTPAKKATRADSKSSSKK